MNLPNALTVFRIVLIPLYLYVFFQPFPYHVEIALGILILAGLTDIADGYIARKHKLVTTFGTMMDPLADKLMMMAVIASLFLTERISVWATLIFFARDAGMIAVSAVYHLRGKKTVPANAFGKITTVLFYIAFPMVIYRYQYGELILWSVILFSFVTTAIYLVKFRLMNRVY
ncbi:CDP-alcohol phosphatidyltransferase family protein [Brevibacillus composti]|uniref:Phosphatidylglycerophosphate synthase n=1 Tax=Brevibacillus composti TaxID=2796470 RepID=A0A7T5JNL0_9BACL|nr:CDP-alcohol phosphatidyltransferase family protein [Brevibacillus composti]QQE74192.1 CDP-alcohol phosphatidyltransferase family protein [Brevibacillus composti]QUO41274.1 CDP-alcohol phosphatidyltransferase family protein [Brevibacillus composti]